MNNNREWTRRDANEGKYGHDSNREGTQRDRNREWTRIDANEGNMTTIGTAKGREGTRMRGNMATKERKGHKGFAFFHA
jgi:hypothetical protein